MEFRTGRIGRAKTQRWSKQVVFVQKVDSVHASLSLSGVMVRNEAEESGRHISELHENQLET